MFLATHFRTAETFSIIYLWKLDYTVNTDSGILPDAAEMWCFRIGKTTANGISYHILETDINFELVTYECGVSTRGLPGFRAETLIQVVRLS